MIELKLTFDSVESLMKALAAIQGRPHQVIDDAGAPQERGSVEEPVKAPRGRKPKSKPEPTSESEPPKEPELESAPESASDPDQDADLEFETGPEIVTIESLNMLLQKIAKTPALGLQTAKKIFAEHSGGAERLADMDKALFPALHAALKGVVDGIE